MSRVVNLGGDQIHKPLRDLLQLECFFIPRVKPADTIVLLDGLCERFDILLLQGNAKGLYKSQNHKTLVTPRACTDLIGTKSQVTPRVQGPKFLSQYYV